MRPAAARLALATTAYLAISSIVICAHATNEQDTDFDTAVENIVEQPSEDLIAVLESAAASGSADAALALGNRYFHGRDVTQALPRALEWWHRASDLGSPEAAYNLGVAYINGFGTAKNTDSARAAFTQSADKNFPKALLALGILELQSAGSDDEKLKAGEFFRQAAEKGNRVARENLALMYERGIGFDADAEQAQYWRDFEPSKPAQNERPPVHTTDWVESRNPDHYTLQLVSGDTFADTQRLIASIDSLQCAIFNKVLAERTRFVAIAGEFEQFSKASDALNKLPPELRKNDPFIVKFQVLQRQIAAHTKINN